MQEPRPTYEELVDMLQRAHRYAVEGSKMEFNELDKLSQDIQRMARLEIT